MTESPQSGFGKFWEDFQGELKKKLPGFSVVLAVVGTLGSATGWKSEVSISLVVLVAYLLASSLDPLFDDFFRPASQGAKPPARLRWLPIYSTLEDAREEARERLGLENTSANIYRFCRLLFEHTEEWGSKVELLLQSSKALRTFVFLLPGLMIALRIGAWPASGPIAGWAKGMSLWWGLVISLTCLFSSFWLRIGHMKALYALPPKGGISVREIAAAGKNIRVFESAGRLLDYDYFVKTLALNEAGGQHPRP